MNTPVLPILCFQTKQKFYKSKSINNFNSNLLKPPLNKTIWPYSVFCVYFEMKNVYVYSRVS